MRILKDIQGPSGIYNSEERIVLDYSRRAAFDYSLTQLIEATNLEHSTHAGGDVTYMPPVRKLTDFVLIPLQSYCLSSTDCGITPI